MLLRHAFQGVSLPFRAAHHYLGLTEPGIVAAEAPNPIVNQLVIMPDVEKRLEAFVRTGQGFVVFPGGAGTAEELLFVLGILLHPDNAGMPFPLVLTGPKSAAKFLQQLDRFIGATLGAEAQQRYKIIVDDPAQAAREIQAGIEEVHAFRKENHDAYYYNWLLHIEHDFQQPFHPTHKAMRSLHLHKEQPIHLLAANLRRAFSGIVAGNVKEYGIRAIEKHGGVRTARRFGHHGAGGCAAGVLRRAAADEAAWEAL